MGVPYGAGEFDRTTNAGALGFGAACVVSVKYFDVDTNESVGTTKIIVHKTICAG